MVSAQAVRLEPADGQYRIHLADDATLISRAVVLATGARYRKLAVPGLEAYEGNGVYYAATYQDALMGGSEPVVIVGGGNSAGQVAIFLASRVTRVHLLIRGDNLARTAGTAAAPACGQASDLASVTDAIVALVRRPWGSTGSSQAGILVRLGLVSGAPRQIRWQSAIRRAQCRVPTTRGWCRR